MSARRLSSGFQKDVTLTQYASFSTRSLKPNASNISIVLQATPSAWPRSSRPGFCSTMRVLMSGKAASCAASVRPAGPQPTIRTSTSAGSASEVGNASTDSNVSKISGSPGLNPLRWNCMVHSSAPTGQQAFPAKWRLYNDLIIRHRLRGRQGFSLLTGANGPAPDGRKAAATAFSGQHAQTGSHLGHAANGFLHAAAFEALRQRLSLFRQQSG